MNIFTVASDTFVLLSGYYKKASFKKHKCAKLLVVYIWDDLQCYSNIHSGF